MPSTSASQCTLLPFASGGVNLTYVPFSPLILRVNLMQLIEEATEGCWIGHRARMFTSEIGSVYSPPKADRQQQQSAIMTKPNKHVETVIEIGHSEAVRAPSPAAVDDGPPARSTVKSSRRVPLQGWMLRCEKGGIRRVLMNLFGNSLKFTSVSVSRPDREETGRWADGSGECRTDTYT